MRYGLALLSALILSLAVTAAGSAEPTIGSKRAEAQQVLAQINAMDAQLEKAVEAWNGANVRLTVADSGPGLTEEQAAHVFERFYRADESRARTGGGAGLGLSIVAAVAGAHGGRVSAAPAPEGGAAFTVELPLA